MEQDKKKKNGFGGMLILAVGAAIGAATYKLFSEAGKEADRQARKPIDILIQNQSVVQSYGAQDVKNWFIEQTQNNTSGKTLLLAYPNEELLEKFGYEGSEQLDQRHYLLLAAIDAQEEVAGLSLVNFMDLDEELWDLLENHGGVVYIEG